MKKNRNGFTLAELLIVVVIIAVLVAISIPIFSRRAEGLWMYQTIETLNQPS